MFPTPFRVVVDARDGITGDGAEELSRPCFEGRAPLLLG